MGEQVKYGVGSSKFIWAPYCAQLYSLAETPQLPSSPHLGSYKKGRYWSAKIEDISLKPPEWEVYRKPAIAERDEKQVMIVSPRNLDKVV
jgi:hypothetical protein